MQNIHLFCIRKSIEKARHDEHWAIMPSKYTDEIENASDTWRVFLYGKKIKIFTPAKVNYYQ